MFSEILITLQSQKKEYLKLKEEVDEIKPLYKSFEVIIEQIDNNINKISNLNKKNSKFDLKYETDF